MGVWKLEHVRERLALQSYNREGAYESEDIIGLPEIGKCSGSRSIERVCKPEGGTSEACKSMDGEVCNAKFGVYWLYINAYAYDGESNAARSHDGVPLAVSSQGI